MALKEGVFGAHLVEWFKDNEDASNLPVHAEALDEVSPTEITYRITFEDGTVSDFKITFISEHTLEILSAEEFNRVI